MHGGYQYAPRHHPRSPEEHPQHNIARLQHRRFSHRYLRARTMDGLRYDAEHRVLGIPTLVYLPFCFFNIISPLMSCLVAILGFVPKPQPQQVAEEN